MVQKRDISIVICIAAFGLIAMLAASISAQNRIRDWQKAYTSSSEKPTAIAASLILEHFRFQNTLVGYYTNIDELKRVELNTRLNVYLSRLLLLETHKAQFLESPNKFKIEGLAPDTHTPILVATVKKLIDLGQPTLRQLEELINTGQPDDAQIKTRVNTLLSTLAEPLATLNTHAFERERYLDQIQVELSEQLRLRLWHAYLSIGLGIGLAAVSLMRRWHEKARSAANLKHINTKLRVKIRESERLTAELHFQANHDVLSGLYNRHGFNVQLEAILTSCSGKHGLCFVDLDLFKVINDTCGHAAGDTLIQEVSNLLLTNALPGTIVGRYGGDEFLMLTPDCDYIEFKSMVETCCIGMKSMKFEFNNQSFNTTGSFGATHFAAIDHSMQSLMAVVDAACYEAKRAGGGRVQFHSDNNELVEARQSDLNWVSKIHYALANNSFVLYGQKIASLRPDDKMLDDSYEILVRMTDTSGDVLLPSRFLQVAEHYGLAPRIDRWVVRRTFNWLNRHADEMSLKCLNINLSGRSVGDPEFLHFIEDMTEAMQIDTSLVCFEITETAIVGKLAKEFLRRLKSLGYKIALDDFGSGFSSFGYLETLPVDRIKIDGMFVQDIETNETHREFVKAIATVGRAMGKQVVAEFVQNQAAIDVLRELEVDFGQGYFIGRPERLLDHTEKQEAPSFSKRMPA